MIVKGREVAASLDEGAEGVGGVFGEGGPRGEAAADDEGLDGAISTRGRFGDIDIGEDATELRLEERGVVAAENLGDEGATGREESARDLESRREQLRVRLFVEVVQPSHLWRTIAHHDVRELAACVCCLARAKIKLESLSLERFP